MLAVLLTILIIGSAYFILRRFGGEVFESSWDIVAAAVSLGLATWAGVSSILMIFLPTTVGALASVFLIIILGVLSFIKLKKAVFYAIS